MNKKIDPLKQWKKDQLRDDLTDAAKIAGFITAYVLMFFVLAFLVLIVVYVGGFWAFLAGFVALGIFVFVSAFAASRL